MKEIYLDNSATTKMKTKVVETMKKSLTKNYGNPSSLHKLGERTLKSMNGVREELAREIGAKSSEIIFTSGGTESNNLAIQGLARANSKKKKIIISSIEHPSVTETCKFMKSQGYKIVKISVDKEGILDIEQLEKKIDKNTLLVSVMHVNNVFGTIQDLNKIGKICKRKKVYFHTDAVQSFGKLEINVRNMNLDLLSSSAHKIGGPKGIGFLYIKEGTRINSLFFGGGQERNLRTGTENVSGIAGFGKALELEKEIDKFRIVKLRNKLIDELENLGGKINGSKKRRIFDNVHVSFEGIDSENLVYYLSEKGIYVSVGSACEGKKKKESGILKSLGLDKKEIKGSLRLSLGGKTTGKDIRKVVKEIVRYLKNNYSASKPSSSIAT